MNFFKSNNNKKVVYNDNYFGLGTASSGIDLRVEMHTILYGNASKQPLGHWIIYRRFDTTKFSQYYNHTTKEAVGGPAYEYKDEIIRTRRVPIKQQLDSYGVGKKIEDQYIYYFEYTIKPKRGDQIIELWLDDHSSKPVNIPKNIMHERYIITSVHPYRLEQGNIQYYSTEAERDMVTY